MLVHTTLVAAEVAGLRAGGLHEVEEGFAVHQPVVRVLLADHYASVKSAAIIRLPLATQLRLILALVSLVILEEPRLLLQCFVLLLVNQLVRAANHQEFLIFVKSAGDYVGRWGLWVIHHC